MVFDMVHEHCVVQSCVKAHEECKVLVHLALWTGDAKCKGRLLGLEGAID